ncbi:hypothetical protein GU926_08145 [Nibribacter ruber]|uniref:HNH nuclease domain-containing protein n=1 Tax=Nibribacter ruber TaxID=2698458 RepID=A0A6P1NU56_9BACT|nr:HNH endonuclease [Nibribacter ruber]QHL87406.1 hypothetical protein GU926_08145 [Nibribacter ruber]
MILNIDLLPNEVWETPIVIRSSQVLRFTKYLVSNKGRVYSLVNESLMSLNSRVRGYVSVNLMMQKGKYATITVHRLVAGTFIENPENNTHVNHKDGVRHNNNVENLEWTTCKDNINHGHTRRRKFTDKELATLLKDRPDLYSAVLEMKQYLLEKKVFGEGPISPICISYSIEKRDYNIRIE